MQLHREIQVYLCSSQKFIPKPSGWVHRCLQVCIIHYSMHHFISKASPTSTACLYNFSCIDTAKTYCLLFLLSIACLSLNHSSKLALIVIWLCNLYAQKYIKEKCKLARFCSVGHK